MLHQIQFTLTVNAGKWIIAKAISELGCIKESLSNGKLILFGGTTVSALAEILFGKALRLSGRVSTRGTVTAFQKKREVPHTMLFTQGKIYDLERDVEVQKLLQSIEKSDVVVSGANGYDVNGNAFLMAGTYGLGDRINLLAPIHTEGAKVLIAVGLEKLIPGSTLEAIKCSGRNSSIWSMGASVGLVPLVGEIINEIEAIKILFGIKPVVIGRGGIQGAEGSSTFVAQGERETLQRLISLIEWASQQKLSGISESIKECERGVKACARHKGCCYKSGKLFNGF
ncbi:MAG: hypothetical protein Kow00103_07290 [Candidatus Caldatribacteriota bacterium]